jgi:hypothetical protein
MSVFWSCYAGISYARVFDPTHPVWRHCVSKQCCIKGLHFIFEVELASGLRNSQNMDRGARIGRYQLHNIHILWCWVQFMNFLIKDIRLSNDRQIVSLIWRPCNSLIINTSEKIAVIFIYKVHFDFIDKYKES